MILLWIAALLITGGLLALIMMAGNAELSDSDHHYQYVGLCNLTQNAANDYTEVKIKSGESATNSGTAVIVNDLGGEIVPGAFGKGLKGMGFAVWDVKEFVIDFSIPAEQEAGQTNRQECGVHTDDDTLTSSPNPSADEYLFKVRAWEETTTGQAGEITQSQQDTTVHKQMPMDLFDGDSFHYLATAAAYKFFIVSAGQAIAHTAYLGMFARRVIVRLDELFFDRATMDELLDGVVLEAIFD